MCQDKTYTFAPGNPTLVNSTIYDGNVCQRMAMYDRLLMARLFHSSLLHTTGRLTSECR